MMNFNINNILIFLFLSGILFLVLIFIKIKRRQKLNRKNEAEEREFQELLLRSKLEIGAEALKNFSGEIQDNISQSLVLARLNLNSLVKEAPSETLNSTIELIGKVLGDLRNINKNIKDEFYASQTLEVSIRRQLTMLKKSDIFFADLKVFGDEPYIKPENKIILLRMVQECLKNIINSSGARLVNVSCIFKEKGINVIIEDNFIENIGNEKIPFIKKIRNKSFLMDTLVTIKTYHGNGTGILIEANI